MLSPRCVIIEAPLDSTKRLTPGPGDRRSVLLLFYPTRPPVVVLRGSRTPVTCRKPSAQLFLQRPDRGHSEGSAPTILYYCGCRMGWCGQHTDLEDGIDRPPI